MIEKIMPDLKDAGEYTTALAMFRETPLTGEETDRLLKIYADFQPERGEDTDFLKLCLAADLLAEHPSADAGFFAALELSGAALAALFTAQKILTTGWIMESGDTAALAVEQVLDESACLPSRVLLARVALDVMIGARNFADIQAQIRTLAAFLSSLDTETLDRYTTLVTEVRTRCGM